MRALAAVAVGAGLLAVTLPAAPASASCIAITAEETCTPCVPLDALYQGLDETAGGALPDREFPCLD
jgi:hypothetical protein